MNLSKILNRLIRPAFRFWILSLVFYVITLAPVQVQGYVPSDNRADANYRRHSNLDGNNVRVTVHNFGLNGWESKEPDLWAFEWPKNTKREYIVFVSIWLGGEVTNDLGETVNIVDISTSRSSPTGNPYSLLPVPGFLNPDHPNKELARSDDLTSWPRAADGGWKDKMDDTNDPGWIGSWNGFFGKNVYNADLEMYYRCGDDLYNRGNYIPDTTDRTRGGLGLLMDERAFAWTQILINDVVFFINDIKNDATKRIGRTVFTIWLADLVGGDSNDDEPYVDLQTNIAFLTDHDRVGTDPWAGTTVGLGSVKYIETPGNQVNGIDDDGDADAEENANLLTRIDGDPAVRIPLFTSDDISSLSLTA